MIVIRSIRVRFQSRVTLYREMLETALSYKRDAQCGYAQADPVADLGERA